jgi:hydroxypyruvate reductase
MPDLKELATRVFLESLRAIEPGSKIQEKLQINADVLNVGGKRIILDQYREVVLIGMGKASMTMGAGVEALLGDRIERGILVTHHRFNIDVRS